MATYGRKAQKVNKIQRERDNTSDLAEAELRVRSRKRKAASDQSVPGQVVTAPPTKITPLGG